MHAIKWLVMGGVVLGLVSCSGAKYRDVRAAINRQADATEEFTARMEKADSAREAAAAVDDYSDRLENIQAQARKLKEKYAGVDLQNAPELKAENERAEQAAMKFAGVFMKATLKYGRDPEFQAAMKRWQQTMREMGNP